MDGSLGTPAHTGGRAPRPFLKRGEGVEKRVFASRYRKPAPAGASGAGRSSGGGDSGVETSEDVPGRRGDQHGRRGMSAEPSRQSKAHELASDTQLLGVEQTPDQPLDGGHVSSRFLRNSVKAAWDTKQAEEELELEEFRALETQIKADVVGGSRQRSEQQALPSNAALPPAGPNNGGRSYASIHQHRPPQPPRAASRSGSDRSLASSSAVQRAATAWSPSQPQSQPQQQQQYEAFEFAGADGDVDNDGEYAEGFGDADEPELGMDAAWSRQHSFFGKPGTADAADGGGRGAGSRGVSSSAGGGFGQGSTESAAWGSDSGRAAAASLRHGASPQVSAFDDGDAWNDTSSFFGGGAGAGGRKGAAGVAAAASMGKPRGGGGGGDAFQPATAQLEDPWAAPVGGGEGLYGTEGDAFMQGSDDQGWGMDKQAQQQQLRQQLQSQPGAKDEERGPDQPFVRALFNKQRQQQQPQGGSGGVRPPGKAAGGPAGKGKAAAEPAGPSPAETERLQALEEQAANMSSERSALVRMRTELEKAANRLEQERHTWERSRAEEQARWEAQRDAEEARLRRDRRVLEKQSKALLKMPNKKERSAMEAAEAALEAERREGRAREARHKLTVERLRRQLVELQERNHELREEVRWHEAQQLERGWPPQGAAAAGAPGTRPGAGQQQPPAKSRPCKSVAAQTEPLPFLSPLDRGGAEGSPLHDPRVVRQGAMRSGEAAGGGAAASSGRPKSSGSNLPTAAGGGGGGAMGPSRMRTMQASRSAATPHATKQHAAQQPQQQVQPPQSAFRAVRAVGQRGAGGGGSGAAAAQVYGSASRWTEGDVDEEAVEDEYGEDADEDAAAMKAFYARQGRTMRQQPATHASRSDPWWRGDEQAGGPDDYDNPAVGDDEEMAEDEYEGMYAQHMRAGAGRGGDGGGGGGGGYGRMRGGSAAPGATAAMDSPSAGSYMQNDDVEVLTDEGAGEGLDADGLSALAWQQHQEFLARVGMAPDGREPQHGRDRTSGMGAGLGPGQRQSQQPQQPLRQPQQPPQWQPQASSLGEHEAGSTGRQGVAGNRPGQPQQPPRGTNPQLQQQQPSAGFGPQHGRPGGQQQPPPQHQQPQPTSQAGAFTAVQQRTSGGNGGSGGYGAASQSAFFGGGQQTRPGPGEAGMAATGPRSGPPGVRHPGSDQGDPAVDLGDVSQTLAALRMGRRVEAAAAASAATSHGDNGMSGFGLPGRQQEGRPMGHMAGPRGGWSADAWSPASGAGGGPGPAPGSGSGAASVYPPANSRHAQGPACEWAPAAQVHGAARGGPTAMNRGPEWPSAGQQHSQQTLQRQTGRPGGGGVTGPGGVMAGTAAGAAAVAQAVATQQFREAPTHQHQQQAPGGVASGMTGSRVGNGSGSGGGAETLVREVRHADGKVERMYSSGRRLVLFANGTRKVALPDGSSRVYFANGDIKWSIPAAAAAAAAAAASSPSSPQPPGIGVVHYYYAEVSTWHSTYGGEGGVEVFYFPSGQTEAHHPGHGKEIMFPDGVMRVVTAEGEEVDVTWQQLSWAIQQPQPQVEGLGDDDL